MGGLRFLPWVRDGVARVVADTDPLAGALPRARAAVDLTVTALGTETATGTTREITGTSTALLHGPGDVVGVDPDEIIRSFPAPGAENVEVSMFAAVEFDRPDLPWLYTPARPDANGGLRPWLVLVVVPVDGGGALRTEAGQALPRLATTVRQLPALAESWAWAHAQVLVTTEDEDVSAVIATAPERTLSRLVCPRRLAAGAEYLAAVVPAFEAGVRAGLGEPVADTGPLAPAWGPGSAHPGPDDAVLLPVYHHWTFRTGPDGDFESLARRLRARPLPADVGRQPVDIAAPGGGLPAQAEEGVEGRSVLGFEGALASPAMTPTAWADDVRAAWQGALTGLLRHSADRLTPPLYGDLHSQETQLPAPGAEPRWLAGLNLDPRHRAAAALGTQVVQRHQEDLAAAAWQRAAEIREANEQLRRGQAARDTAEALYARRVDPDAPGATVGDDRLVALTRPVHDLVEVSHPGLAADTAEPLDRRLAGNPGAAAATSAPVRRLLRPRGPLARRIDTDGAAALTRLAGGASAVPAARVPAGGAVLDTLVSDGRGVGDLTRAVIEAAAANPWWHTASGTVRALAAPATALAADDPVTRVVTNGGDLLTGDRFFVGAADGRLFERRRLGPDRWVWRDHGAPPGTAVATSGAVVAPGRVYVRTHDSRLFERSWDGDRWAWADCGAPAGGVHSRPAASGGGLIFVLGGDTALWRFDPTARSWTSLGTPVGGTERLWGTPRPSFVGVLVATSNNRLFAHNGQWRAFTGPATWGSPAAEHRYPNGQYGIEYVTPDGRLVSLFSDGSTYLHDPAPDGRRVVSLAQEAAPFGNEEELAIVTLGASTSNPADVRLMTRYLWYHDIQERYLWAWRTETTQVPAGGFGAHRPGPLVGDSRDGELFAVTADGRLTSWRWGYPRPTAWVDHGTPADPRGSGPADAPAPAHVRFAPKVGLLSSLVFTHTVTQGAGSRPRTQVAHSLTEDGAVREPALTAAVDGPAVPAVARATATTLGAVLPTARPTLVTAALLPGTTAGTARIAYWIGREADANGAAAGGWTGPFELPDPVSAETAGLDVALADLDGDGRPELIVAYAVNRAGRTDNRVFYRVGWRLDETGAVADGWTDSLPTPMQFGSVTAVGVDVVDLTGDQTPDLLVFATGAVGGAPAARYVVGKGVNRRGRVVGGWTVARPAPDEAALADADGAGVAVADITGTRRPDLVVARRKGATVTWRAAFDLDPDGVPVSWTPALTATGAADAGARGCAVTIADLRADLVTDRAKMGDAFMAAAANHQGRLAPAQALARDHHPAPVALDDAAAAVRETVRPETAVAGEVLAGLTLGDGDLVDALPDSGDPLRRLLAGVTFDVPAYELLRGLSQEHVVPNLPAVAPETMTALAANPRFIEAFLVGLNHEMSREMLWREFPADPRQTWFRQFWDVRGAVSAGAPLTDIPPLTDPAWRNGALGSHLTAVGAPGEQSLVLVIRGELLRRYPSTVVTMRAATWTGPEERTPTGPDVLPIFNAWLSPDLLLFGFPYTAEVARGADGSAGHFFVLREQPAAPRFGVDLTGDPPPPDAVVFAARQGRNAADTARAVLQRPVLLARHASDLLPTPESQS